MGRRVERLGDEVAALRNLVSTQMTMVRGLVDGLAPLLDEITDVAGSTADSGENEACTGAIAELTARLQQQQLALEEAQRRAKKAEKLAAALDEAEARSASEIERLNNALATARVRQAEALQQSVQLERRLADAEARLQPVSTGASAERAARNSTAPDSVSTDQNGEQTQTAARTAPATGAGDDVAAGETAPESAKNGATVVVYEVRASDTLSSISDRVYGDAGAWERIYEANRDLLSSPEALQPGMPLVIP